MKRVQFASIIAFLIILGLPLNASSSRLPQSVAKKPMGKSWGHC